MGWGGSKEEQVRIAQLKEQAQPHSLRARLTHEGQWRDVRVGRRRMSAAEVERAVIGDLRAVNTIER